MITRNFNIIFFSLICILFSSIITNAQNDLKERHIQVALRMIGHKILLNSGDSVSRVLAIEKEADRYKIQFESDFQFSPDELVATINQVVTETSIAISYLVELEKCETKLVVYSYEIGNSRRTDIIPCKTRMHPKACYKLFFSILDSSHISANLQTHTPESKEELNSEKKQINYFSGGILVLTLLILIGFFIYFPKKKSKSKTDPEIIYIGKYKFDKKEMTLTHENEKTELSSREADLLFLLYSSENKTLEREHILKIVWQDEGDYVGRTLDVFISNLRKKLIADSNIKIVNIRGIGYKFVMNNQD